ncbi:MAG: hypothetical protein OEW75_11795 [Cyclobacteriaceae bacterium]|nr:hypothetical protein [Cyclobacteriaceae bacterium]
MLNLKELSNPRNDKMIPNPLQSNIAISQYLIIAGILFYGIKQYILFKKGHETNKSYVIPLGALCLIFGFIGLFITMKEAFNSIEAAGDISPQIVAHSISAAYDYPILGLIGLALSYAFKFINSEIQST